MEAVLKLIETHGLALVISAMVVYAGLQFMNIYFAWFKRKFEKEHEDRLGLRREVNEKITEMLDRLMLKADSSRAFVFEFHNGENGIGTLPFLKMSNTFEVVNNGISRQAHNLQGVACSLYSGLVRKIEVEDYVLLDVNNRRPDISNITYETLLEQDILVTLIIKLTDDKCKLIGYIGLDFCCGNNNYSERHIDLLEEYAMKVGATLCVT